MTDEETAWLAGLFEGEGSVNHKPKHNVAVLTIGMTDFDVVEKCHQVSGVGRLNGPYQYGNRKPFWIWNVARREDVMAVSEAILPFLGNRRSQRIRDVLGDLRTPRTLLTHCKWGHEFTPENTRIKKSNGRRECKACNTRRTRERRKVQQHK